jgi:metallo-beta-lactamase family protein
MTTIQFLGGTGTVTGSKYLVSSGDKKVLIDCGLFQGLKSLRLQNWNGLPIKASEIHAIILTHAHIDHSGYIPRFIKEGFKGKIFSTPATKDLCEILLPDAGYLAEEEADYLNRHKRSKHDPALPLFTMKEGKAAIEHFETINFDTTKALDPKFSFQFRYVGHILGAASVELTVNGKKIFFTGDIGRENDPIFFAPHSLPADFDYLITESTYGNRLHPTTDPSQDLEKIITDTFNKKGVIIIPSFAVGRAQEIMFYLWQLKKSGRLPSIPIYLNSPMATDVNELFVKYHELHRLTKSEAKEVCQVVKYVRTVEESKALNEKQGPMLILSASGMVSGGRVLHHIKKFGPQENTTILLAGFQAAGTRGEALQNQAHEIKIHGEYVPIRAQIKVLENMSAHADYQEILSWFKKTKARPKMTFITHGEPSAADSLRMRITDSLGWPSIIPQQNQIFEIDEIKK